MEMSASARSREDTPHDKLDEMVAVLKDHARPFARLSPSERAALVRECIPRVVEKAEAWVEAACEAKGLSPSSPASSEEWLGGPMTTVRNLRLLAESLERIARTGSPGPDASKFSRAADGVTTVSYFPHTGIEAALFSGITGEIRFQPGVTAEQARAKQGSFYKKKDPDGGVALILGAGNVASIPPMDALYKLFVEGEVCLVKLNPVNEYLEPFYNHIFGPLVDRGFVRFVKGGGEVGSYLCQHKLVDSVHITGSDRTHDLIVWGPPGPERDRRMAADEPLLKKPISSELGSVTPLVIVPGPYTDKELQYLAEYIATTVVNNASCNCNAGKMLVTSKHWAQRDDLLAKVRAVLRAQAPRKAYYPGAFDRFEALTKGRDVEKLGEAGEGKLPWACIFGLDANAKDEPLFTTEPFCPILSEARLDAHGGAEFLDEATRFCNDRLWGTLSASVFIHPRSQSDPATHEALERSVAALKYGAVGVNVWPGVIYGIVSAPWGAHPSSTMKNIAGGLGWVHNTFMFEDIEKTVVRGPLTAFPKPPMFVTHANAREVARRLIDLEADPRWWKVPGVAVNAMMG
jgi:aldehyde dehydrogenase (NAD(P)+)